MKSRSTLFLLVFIALLFVGGVFWIFNTDEPEVKSGVKVNNTFSGLEKRQYKTIQLKDSFELNDVTYDLFTIGEKFYTISGEQELSLNLLDKGFKINKPLSVDGYSISKYTISSQKKSFLFKDNNDEKISIYSLEDDKLNSICDDLPYDFTAQFNDSLYVYFGSRPDSLYLQLFNVFSKRKDSINLSKFHKSTSKNLGFLLNGNLSVVDECLYHFPLNCSYGFKLTIKKLVLTMFNTIDSTKIPRFKEVVVSEGVTKFSVEPEIFTNIKQVVYKNNLANLSYITEPVNGKIQKNSGAVIDIYDVNLNYKMSWKIPSHQNKYSPISFCFSKDEKLLYVLFEDNTQVKVFELHD